MYLSICLSVSIKDYSKTNNLSEIGYMHMAWPKNNSSHFEKDVDPILYRNLRHFVYSL